MDKPISVLTYEQLDRWILSLQHVLAAEEFFCVIGILRGGAPLALMVSHAIGVQVAFLRYERASRTVKWDSSLPLPSPSSKVLLCEDIAGSGDTLADCTAFLKGHGLTIKTLTAAYDELSRVRPDYGIDAVGYFASFPWERHAYTDAYRADWTRTKAGRHGELLQDNEYMAMAIDLDGILLPDLPPPNDLADIELALQESEDASPFLALPDVELDKVRAVVTGRPGHYCPRTEEWLTKRGLGRIPLVTRDPTRHSPDIVGTVMHKAEAALRLRCTMFIESDLEQAILISERAPLLSVVWWDVANRQGKLVGAHTWEGP